MDKITGRKILLCLLMSLVVACNACTSAETPTEAPSACPTCPPQSRLQEPGREISAYAITPDGALWYSFDVFDGVGGHLPYIKDLGLYRRLDSRVYHFDIGNTIRALEVAPDGSLYVGAGCGVLRCSEDEWQTLAAIDCENTAFQGPMFPLDFAFAENGDLWVGGNLSLARFDGEAWTEYDIAARRILLAPDGSLWADGWDGIQGSDCCFTHLTGSTWVTYTHTAPLPVSDQLAQQIHQLRK